MRLLHLPPLTLLLGLGLAPFFLLFPLLPGGAEHDPTLRPVEIWIGAAFLGGFAGALDGTARYLYRIAGLMLAATLLSALSMPLTVQSGLPFPLRLATLLGLSGENAQDAALYEIWLAAWLSGLGLLLLGWYGLVWLRRGRAAQSGGHRV